MLAHATTARIAVAAVMAAAAGLAAGATPAAGQPVGVTTYTCGFPSGQELVAVRVAASVPARAAVGRRLRPSRLAVTLPHSVLTGLPGAGSGPVAVTGRLAILYAQRGAPVSARWAVLRATAETASTAPAVRLIPSGPLPAARPGKQSPLTVSAGQLQLSFAFAAPAPSPSPSSPGPTPSPSPSPSVSPSPTSTATSASPAGGPASPGPRAATPTAPMTTVSVQCTPAAGQDTMLASVSVAARRGSAKHHRPGCPSEPKGGLKLNRRFPVPRPPKGATILHGAVPACAYVYGYSDVRKLREAALVGPGLSAITLYVRQAFKGASYFQEDSAAQLDYQSCPTCKVVHALPPARATFLAFGFMPVQATMRLTEVGNMNIISLGTTTTLHTSTVWSLMRLRVYNVKVDGRPLDVGAHCGPVRPILTVLVGRPSSTPTYSLLGGGPLIGRISIPRFSGCGVTENLNPILNASISGPGNLIELTQGQVCVAVSGSKCRPRIPKPIH